MASNGSTRPAVNWRDYWGSASRRSSETYGCWWRRAGWSARSTMPAGASSTTPTGWGLLPPCRMGADSLSALNRTSCLLLQPANPRSVVHCHCKQPETAKTENDLALLLFRGFAADPLGHRGLPAGAAASFPEYEWSWGIGGRWRGDSLDAAGGIQVF